MDGLQNASYESKQTLSLPKGAEITKKSCNLTVREIDNGFIVRKSYDITYTVDGNKNYEHYTQEFYSKTNPMKIEVKGQESIFDKI